MATTAEAVRLAAAWSRPDPAKSPGLAAEFERLFVGPGPVPCPPYESYWRDDAPFLLRRTLMGPCTVELVGLYSRLGLQVSPLAAELPDNVAVEFEALAVAVQEGRDDLVADLLHGHLAHWLPAFCAGVTRETLSPFYRALATDTAQWLVENGCDIGRSGVR